MKSTSSSLLLRLRNQEDREAWREFDLRYRGLLLRFCKRRGLQETDAEDVVQLVLAGLAQAIPAFSYDPERGRFRDYLFRSTEHAPARWASQRQRAAQPFESKLTQDLASSALDPAHSQLWEEEWIAHHYRLAMESVRKSFAPVSVAIFDKSVAGSNVDELAREYGMSEAAVHKVRQRIRDRMEELIAEQVREEDACDGREA